MAQQLINIGSSANKGDGDAIRTAFDKVNDNFTELYLDVVDLKISAGAGNGATIVAEAIKGDVIGQDSAVIVDSSNATVTATLVGDVNGSIYADDSTLLVDGVNGTIPGYIKLSVLKTEVAASADFADFQTRIAAL